MGRVPREKFVPADLAALAYIDRPITIGGGRRLNPPLVTARLLVAADLAPGQHVLLIGAATGYAAALLDELGVQTTAIESDATLAAAAASALGARNVTVKTAALAEGATDAAPYDRILIDGAVEHVPDALAAQLADGGVLVALSATGRSPGWCAA